MKVIATLTVFRFGLKKWEEEVNSWLDQGWGVAEWKVEHRLLRTVAVAVLVKESGCCDK